MTKLYTVTNVGTLSAPLIVADYFDNCAPEDDRGYCLPSTRSVNHGQNAFDAHFQALAAGYTLHGTQTKAYREALEAL